jgi:hypothetical protein
LGSSNSLSDPGANGPIKRTAPNVTAPATSVDITGLFSGTCDASHVLFGNGSCQVVSGSIAGSPNISTQVSGTGSAFASQPKPIYDSRDWMTCDGSTDTSAGLRTLLAAVGTQEATIRWIGTTTPTASCSVGNFLTATNITNDFSGGGSIHLISSSTSPGGAAFVNGTSAECELGPTHTSCSTANAAHGSTTLAVTAGNTILVVAAPYPGFTFKFTSVTDNCGDLFYHVQQSTAGQSRNTGLWVASSAQGGTCTITANANGALTHSEVMVEQFSGMGPVVSPDGKGATNNADSTTMSAGPAATTTGSLLVSYGGQQFTTETCTAGAGFTQPAGLAGQTTNGLQCFQYQLASAGGNVTATQTITSSPTGSWVYSLQPLKVGNATATILGGIINPDMHQIFFNGDGGTGHGAVDFTNNTGITTVYPEWWGAGNAATAANNTLALQAAVYGAFGGGPLASRPNGSGLNIFNKTLYLTSNYPIGGELKFYDVIGFTVVCNNRLSAGITQTASNLRIIDGQSVAYGAFDDCTWTGSTSSTQPLVDLDFNGVTTAGDLATQFVDFHRNTFNGNNVVAYGGLFSKSGGNAQGSNIYCWDCETIGFTTAGWQFGLPSAYATNALAIGYIGGDIQSCPNFGLAFYGAGYAQIFGTTFEDGFSSQTGYDIYGEQTQGPLDIQNVRSESAYFAAGSSLTMKNSGTGTGQATFPVPGTTLPNGTILIGSNFGWNGYYWTVTVDAGAGFGGIGTPSAPLTASGGSATTLTDTNDTVAGSVTNKIFTFNETVTQAVTGSTATLINVPASTDFITGSVTSGVFVASETATQATSGATGVLSGTPVGTGNMFFSSISGSPDATHIWTGGTSGATYTPTSNVTFGTATMLITAPSGSPDGTHNWTGGTSSAVFTPSGAPVAQAAWTVNAFNGMLVTILSGTGASCIGVVTSNTATAITFTGGFSTKYPQRACVTPDTTSSFIVEPNWGAGGTLTDGTMTIAQSTKLALTGGPISGASTVDLENVTLPGGQLNINTSNASNLKNVSVTIPVWASQISGNPEGSMQDNDWDVHVSQLLRISGGGSYYQNTSLPFSGAGQRTLVAPLQRNLGTVPMVWSCSALGGGAACLDTWIGGRSDPAASNSTSRNILEFGGMLGRPTPFGTDQNGTATQIQGGLPTGAGTPGNIEFWFAPGGGTTGTSVQSGAKSFTFAPTGETLPSFTFANLPTVANGTMLYCSDCKNVTDDTTGTFDSVAASGGHGTNVLRENGAWRVH